MIPAGPQPTLRGVRVERSGRTLLDVPRLDLPAGEVTAVLGPSGAGKSTLLRVLAGLQTPEAGEVRVGGRPPRPGEVVMVFQRPLLLRGTAAENAALGGQLRGDPVARHAGREWLGRLAMGPLARRPVARLSGGEHQRVALARALVLQPPLLLLDEPTANLDPENVARVENEIARYRQERGATVVWVTHNPAQARRVAAFAVLLLRGCVADAASAAAFFGPDAAPCTRGFLNGDFIW